MVERVEPTELEFTKMQLRNCQERTVRLDQELTEIKAALALLVRASGVVEDVLQASGLMPDD